MQYLLNSFRAYYWRNSVLFRFSRYVVVMKYSVNVHHSTLCSIKHSNIPMRGYFCNAHTRYIWLRFVRLCVCAVYFDCKLSISYCSMMPGRALQTNKEVRCNRVLTRGYSRPLNGEALLHTVLHPGERECWTY